MKYDMAVIGAGIPGLAAAALHARTGKKVIVLDPRPGPGGRLADHVLGTQHFPSFPSLVHGFEAKGPYQRLYAALGLPVPAASAASAYQVLLPGHRLTIYPDVPATLDELRREFPEAQDRIARMYREARVLAERGARHPVLSAVHRYRSARGFLRHHGLPRELMALFDIQALFFFGVRSYDCSLAEFLSLLVVPPLALEGGYEGLAAMLATVVAQQGGECRFQEPWPEMHIRSNRIVKLVTEHGAVDARTVVLNSVPQADAQSFSCGIQSTGIPVGMLTTVLVLDDLNRPNDGAAIVRTPHEGVQALTISYLETGGETRSGRPLHEQLSTIIPFLEDFTVTTSVRDLAAELYPLPKQVILRTRRAGVHDRLPLRSSLKNLYVIPDRAPLSRLVDAVFRLVRDIA